MDYIKNLYQDQLVYIFRKDQCLDLKENALVIIKDGCEVKDIEGCLIMHYQDDFESLLKLHLPTKMRKTKQLLSFQESYQILEKGEYGVLSFACHDFPYSVGINHTVMDGHIYFHCGKQGFKLHGIGKRVTFLVIENLGINLEVGTHNHNSVAIFGTLKEVTDIATKKAALLKLVADLAPQHPYSDQMLTFTNILELDIDYMIGKTHIR